MIQFSSCPLASCFLLGIVLLLFLLFPEGGTVITDEEPDAPPEEPSESEPIGILPIGILPQEWTWDKEMLTLHLFCTKGEHLCLPLKSTLLLLSWAVAGEQRSQGFGPDHLGWSACQCRRRGFNSWVSKIPWRMKWQPTPVLLPREPHGQRSLVGYSPQGCKRVRLDLVTKQQNDRTYLV